MADGKERQNLTEQNPETFKKPDGMAFREHEENISTKEDISGQLGEADTWKDQLMTLIRQNKLAAFSAVVIGLIILAAIFAPVVAPYDYLAQSLTGFRILALLTGWERTSWDGMC